MNNINDAMKKLQESRKLKESVSWNYYDKFEDINNKYLPDNGEGETLASQIVTAINKLIYKWYNDGDVFDNVNSNLEGWANDLSSYANWLYKYVDGTQETLKSIYGMSNENDYEILLKKLADEFLDEDFLNQTAKAEKQGTIYDCDGPFEFKEYEEEEEDDYYEDEDYEELDEAKTINNGIQKVTPEKLGEVIENMKDENNYGRFYAKEGDVFVAVDNTTANAWTEEFNTEEDALLWLENTDMTREELGLEESKKLNESWKQKDFKERIEDSLNKLLGEIYEENNIETGDISPEQDMLFNELIEKFDKLFNDLCAQNSFSEEEE